MTLQETICKQVIETLSLRLNNKVKGYPLYTLSDISSFIKSKILQDYKEYYMVNTTTNTRTERDVVWSEYQKIRKEIKGIQFYPKVYKSSDYIVEICVVPNSQGRLNLAQSLHKDLNKYVTKTNLPVKNIWHQINNSWEKTLPDEFKVDYISEENSVTNTSISTVIEFDLSVIDSINF